MLAREARRRLAPELAVASHRAEAPSGLVVVIDALASDSLELRVAVLANKRDAIKRI